MKAQKVTWHIANKELSSEPEAGNEDHLRLVDEIKEVMLNKPKSLQEFFIKLFELQRSKKRRIISESRDRNYHRGL